MKLSFLLKLPFPTLFFFFFLGKSLLVRYRLVLFPLSFLLLTILATYFSTLKSTQSPLILLDYSQEQKLFVSPEQKQLLLSSWKKVAKNQQRSYAVIQQLLNLETDPQIRKKYQEISKYLIPN